jgi:beta-galactosidase
VLFPVITKHGINQKGKAVRYYFNYSTTQQVLVYPHKDGLDLLTGSKVKSGATLTLPAWGSV